MMTASQSALLKAGDVNEAVELAESAIIEALKQASPYQNAFWLVVLDPTVLYDQATKDLPIIYEAGFGETDKKLWIPNRDFQAIAHNKVRLVWKYQIDSLDLMANYPHLFANGDFKFAGGTFLHRIPVAGSGLEWWDDLRLSEHVASNCRSLCIPRMLVMQRSRAIQF